MKMNLNDGLILSLALAILAAIVSNWFVVIQEGPPHFYGYVCDVQTFFPKNLGLCYADLDGNGFVNAGDRGVIAANIGMAGADPLCLYDLDGNGVINTADRGQVSANIGQCVALPPWQDGSGNDLRFPRCGDGIRQIAYEEECDDGNSFNHDGCDSTCAFEELVEEANIVYVDAAPDQNCVGNYNLLTRECNGNEGDSFATLQAAANVILPGYTVLIREGAYSQTNPSVRELLLITTSGTEDSPIVFTNFANEAVQLVGRGFEDRDLDGDGDAEGPLGITNEALIKILGDYIVIDGLQLTNSTRWGIYLAGDHNTIQNVHSHNNWESGLYAEGASNNHIKNFEAHNNRHQSGIYFHPGTSGSHHNLIENAILYNNGFHLDGTRVLSYLGDPAAGGNSDALAFSKFCAEWADAGDNLCKFNTIRKKIGFGNADDGLDVSVSHSIIEDSIMFNNGPLGKRGYKSLRSTIFNNTLRGNIAHANGERGFEMRANATHPGGGIYFYNNLALYHPNRGVSGFTTNSIGKNNLGAFNGGNDFEVGVCGACSNNWAEDVQGNPFFINSNQISILTDFPLLTTPEKIEFIRAQFRLAYTPLPISPLVDAGVVVPGYHCETPGPHLGESCREWFGVAPDIGAFELGA